MPKNNREETKFVPESPNMEDSEREFYLEMIQEQYSNTGRKMSVFNEFEDCLLYYAEDEDGNPRAVYCYEDLVESFAKKNRTTYNEAVEFVEYNTMRTIPYMTHVGGNPHDPAANHPQNKPRFHNSRRFLFREVLF